MPRRDARRHVCEQRRCRWLAQRARGVVGETFVTPATRRAAAWRGAVGGEPACRDERREAKGSVDDEEDEEDDREDGNRDGICTVDGDRSDDRNESDDGKG